MVYHCACVVFYAYIAPIVVYYIAGIVPVNLNVCETIEIVVSEIFDMIIDMVVSSCQVAFVIPAIFQVLNYAVVSGGKSGDKTR